MRVSTYQAHLEQELTKTKVGERWMLGGGGASTGMVVLCVGFGGRRVGGVLGFDWAESECIIKHFIIINFLIL